MKTTELKIKVVFTEPTLGTASGNPDIQEEFIASKAPTATDAAEEVAAIQPVSEQITKASTVFARDAEGSVHCWDYQWKGFFKERVLAFIELGEITHLSPWTYRHAIDQFLFVTPRRILFKDTAGNSITGTLTMLQRPLRATTMKGDRVALASSEMLPAGTTCEFGVTLIEGERVGKAKTKTAGINEEQLRACLVYGKVAGFSQWRTGGYGRFTFECARTE